MLYHHAIYNIVKPAQMNISIRQPFALRQSTLSLSKPSLSHIIVTVQDDHVSNTTNNHFFCPPTEKQICLKQPLQTFTPQRNEEQCIKNKQPHNYIYSFAA